MSTKIDIIKFSQAIQVHLGILQNVINRMASNSSASKSWCITIVSAILVIVADNGKPKFTWISVIPILLFWALDVYYLALEIAFRKSYNDFITKYHSDSLKTEDLYTVLPTGKLRFHLFKSIKSFSTWPFYITLIILVFFAWNIVIKSA